MQLRYNTVKESTERGYIMNFSENLENAKNMALEAAAAAKSKAKQVAAIAKANISIYAEEDKVKKAEQQLGKLYYRDYAVGEEMDTAEYLPWCQKIDESKQLIEELRAYIDELKGAQDEAEPVTADDADFVTADEEGDEDGGISIELEIKKDTDN